VTHRDFDASRAAFVLDREPVTFTLGGELFTLLPDPTLGDCIELDKAPDVDLTKEFNASDPDTAKLIDMLAKFIKRMLPIEDRARFDLALYRIPARHGYVIIEAAEYIVEQSVGFPTAPSVS
jgi:hypothetical protein